MKIFFPFSYIEKGKLNGFFIDITRHILEKKMHYKVISEAFPWERAQEYVKKGESDSHITLITEERKKFLIFNHTPIFKTQAVILYSINNPRKNEIEKIESKNDLKKFKINDYIGNKFSKDNFPISEGFEFEYSSNLEILLKKLDKNRGDIAFVTFSNFTSLAGKKENKENLKSIKVKLIEFIDSKNYFYLALRKDYPNSQIILDEFDTELIKLKKSGEINKFFNKYNISEL
ncbi:substrate-binding periplasmic protein [Silvanigrella sp.]|jgi:polar amino acid transport system substrate-binding protein|uniref:substrate-binding periplasmic protein n=1 Tax=Silvanigrella sp. TaxID=2024976 RepID=UPI0037C90A68